MKKLLTLIILAAVLLIPSCQKELPDAIKNVEVSQGGQTPTPTPTPTPTAELKVSEPGLFGAKGGEQSMTVTATAAWAVSKSEGSDWLTIKPETGNAGTANITLTAAENTSTESRSATVSVWSGDITKKVEVTQVGANLEISLDTNNLEFMASEDSKTFKITTNTSWMVASDQTWCSVSPESGKNDGTVTVKVTENASISERTAIITIKSDVGDQTVKVIQKGAAAVLTLSVNVIDFTSGNGSQTFMISSNTSWTVASDQAWCSMNPSSGNNDATITVSVSENNSTSERTATITVKSEAGEKTVKVKQSGVAATLTLDASSLEFAAGSGSKMFRINSNTAWAVSSNQSWCSVNPTSGNGDGSVTVSVDENTSTSSRTATITIESATITRTLAVTQSGVEPPASQDRTFTVGGVQFKMIYVEGGTFTMGATSEQGDDAYNSEKPTHTVTLSSFSIGETEVTQALWQAVMGQKPTSDGSQWSSTYGLGAKYPAYYVSWNDCQDFISKLNAITGENFRLPTEAEWEYAARGGNKSRGYKYAGSNNIGNVAWYYDNSGALGSNANYGAHSVATKQANELGLYDMSGNVWEWCSDWYGDYSSSSLTNPTGLSSGSYRVIRGGGWGSYAGGCRVSERGNYVPTSRSNTQGLRLAL